MSSARPLILLVEDNPDLRFLAGRQLAMFDVRVDEASDGRMAVEMFTSQDYNYNLVLMDVMMPSTDGIAATKMIREHEEKNKLKRTPIIGITAYANRDACLESGMDDYLFKPVLLEALSEILAKWLPEVDIKDKYQQTRQQAITRVDQASKELLQTSEELKRVSEKLSELKKKFGIADPEEKH